MRHHLVNDIGERAVAVVVVELVGRREIATYIDVGPAVIIIVPPGGGMPLPFAGDSRAFRHVREGAVAIVVEQIIPLASRMIDGIQHVGKNEDIEPAVAVVIAEGGHDGGVLHIQSIGMAHFLEGSVALVDIEQIGGVEPADIDVEPSVIVHVDKGCALFPDHGRVTLVAHPGFVRHILKFPSAEVAKQPAALGLAHDKDIRPAVVIIIADGHAGADRAHLELVITFSPHLGVGIPVLRDQPGLLRRQHLEHRRPARTRPRRQGSPGQTVRGFARPDSPDGKQYGGQRNAARRLPGGTPRHRRIRVLGSRH